MNETIVGLEPFVRRLQQLPDLLNRQIAARAVRRGAEHIRAEMERLAPVSDESRRFRKGGQLIQPGRMKKSAKTKMERHVNDVTARIALWVFYARFYERGSRYQSRRPIMYQAYQSKIAISVHTMGQSLGTDIEKALRVR
jgi:HK97 gp10 family phage protein